MTTKDDMEKRVEKRVEKAVEKGVTRGVSGLVSMAVGLAVSVVVLKFVWGWVASDLFPGAVEQGLINAELTWLASAQLAVLVTVLVGIYHTVVWGFNNPQY